MPVPPIGGLFYINPKYRKWPHSSLRCQVDLWLGQLGFIGDWGMYACLLICFIYLSIYLSIYIYIYNVYRLRLDDKPTYNWGLFCAWRCCPAAGWNESVSPVHCWYTSVAAKMGIERDPSIKQNITLPSNMETLGSSSNKHRNVITILLYENTA